MLKYILQRFLCLCLLTGFAGKSMSCEWTGTPKGKELYDLLLGNGSTKYDLFQWRQGIYTPLYGVFKDRLACETAYLWNVAQGTLKVSYYCAYVDSNPFEGLPEVPFDQPNPPFGSLPGDLDGCGPGSVIGVSNGIEANAAAEVSFIQTEGFQNWLDWPSVISNASANTIIF